MGKKSQASKSTFSGKYTGELATPIYEPGGGLDGSKVEAGRRIFDQRVLKMEKLFDLYSIRRDDPDPGMLLAAKLAMAHVPGMLVRHEHRKKRGRKPSWKSGLGIELVREVDALQQATKMNYGQAIAVLRKDKEKPWRAYTLPNLIITDR